MIGDRIKQLRLSKGLTQESLASIMFVSPQAVSKWEQNLALPDISVLVPLADFFNVSVDYLVRDNTQDVRSMINTSIKQSGKARVFEGSVFNCSEYTFGHIELKTRFINSGGEVVDYWQNVVHNLGPNESKRFEAITRVKSEEMHADVIVVQYSLK